MSIGSNPADQPDELLQSILKLEAIQQFAREQNGDDNTDITTLFKSATFVRIAESECLDAIHAAFREIDAFLEAAPDIAEGKKGDWRHELRHALEHLGVRLPGE